MNVKKSAKKPPAAKPAKAKGSAKRTESPPPPAWDADEAETPAARVLAAVAKIETMNGNPPPAACVPVDPSPVAGGVYAGGFRFAARGILAADGFDLKAVEAAERSFREVAAGRLCLSGEVAAAAAALEIFAGRVATPQGWRNTTESEGPAPFDEIAVQWEVLRWDLLEAVAALYRECDEAERAGVDKPTIKRAAESVRPVTPLLDPLRIPKGANLVDFLSPDWVRRGELFGPAALSPDAPAVLEAFEKVLEGLRDLHALFREKIYTVETDAPDEYQATDPARAETIARIEAKVDELAARKRKASKQARKAGAAGGAGSARAREADGGEKRRRALKAALARMRAAVAKGRSYLAAARSALRAGEPVLKSNGKPIKPETLVRYFKRSRSRAKARGRRK